MDLLGTITATTTAKGQTTTAVPFTIPSGARIVIQPDAACYVSLNADPATLVTSSTGLKLDLDEKLEISTGQRLRYPSICSVTGTVNAKVFLLWENS